MLKKIVILLNIVVLGLFIAQFFITPGIVFFLTANETGLIGKISDLFYMALLFITPLATIILLVKKGEYNKLKEGIEDKMKVIEKEGWIIK